MTYMCPQLGGSKGVVLTNRPQVGSAVDTRTDPLIGMAADTHMSLAEEGLQMLVVVA